MIDRRSDDEIETAVQKLQRLRDNRHFGQLYFYEPLPKVQEFHSMDKRFRALFAGNQDGKTYGGAMEFAMHVTGEYPEWWRGHRFERPIEAWACGEGALLVRDAPQALLCGKPGVEEDWGGGTIPRAKLISKTLGRGVSNGYDQVFVKHRSGGASTITFKSYDQGREKFQSKTLDLWWADEEPDEDIYSELVARVSASRGRGFLTLSPLKGRTKVVTMFLDEPNDDRGFVVMTIWEGIRSRTHSKEEIQGVINGYAKHQRMARAFGVPMAGEGLVFEIDEEAIKERPLAFNMVPPHWRKLGGIDFGVTHPFAYSLIALDPDADVIHLLYGFAIPDQKPLQHADAIKRVAADIPIAWPHDGDSREKGTGEALHLRYRDHGLQLLLEHATNPGGGIHVEPGILEMQERMETGRFKVADNCTAFFKEMRLYHRKDGLIVPENDDLISATRYAIMMRRKAVARPLGARRGRHSMSFMTQNDFDLFTGESA